jgi:enamine deaminase RidA (YjgF/YER057c/UK114 family)
MTQQTVLGKLKAMGLSLPEVAAAVGSYVPAVRSGSIVFVSGQLPSRAGKLQYTGTLGRNCTVEGGQQAARLCALNALAAAAQAAGGMENIARILRLAVFVNSTADFTEQAKVANGASELMQALFGESGRHARLAVGVASLPLDAAVEVELWVECAAVGSASETVI